MKAERMEKKMENESIMNIKPNLSVPKPTLNAKHVAMELAKLLDSGDPKKLDNWTEKKVL